MEMLNAPPVLLSPSGAPHGSAITDEDRQLYGSLANLASGHETHRMIAARVVWLDRQQIDFQAVVYAARDRIMHLAVRVADLEAEAAVASARLAALEAT